MYNPYLLHRSTANYSDYRQSRLNNSLIVDVLKPSFLLHDQHDKNKNGSSLFESTADYSKYHFSEELTKKMAFIDCNPFNKPSEVHIKPLPYPQQEYPKTYFTSSTQENNQQMNQSFVSEFIPVTESFLRQERSSYLGPIRQTYQHTMNTNNHADDRQRQTRIRQILAELDKSSDLFKGHRVEQQKYEQYRDRNRQMYVRNMMDLAHYEQNKHQSAQEENHFQPATHDLGFNRLPQAYSIINRLEDEHEEAINGKFPFGVQESNEEDQQDNDPRNFWKKDESEYQTGQWPIGVPYSITVRGVTYDMVPVV